MPEEHGFGSPYDRDRVDPAFDQPPADRERMVETIRGALTGHDEVRFAYVHGSLLTALPFHDVDVAVYLADPHDASDQAEALAEELSQALKRAHPDLAGPPLDVRVLNEAPLGFCYHVLRGGQLLVSHDEDLRVPWVVRTLSRYLDLLPLRRQALKEVMMGCH